MKTYVASTNAGKFAELRALFAGSPLKIANYNEYVAADERASTYVGNALLKAEALRRQLLRDGVEGAVLADDSGLEVDALAGRPGVLSARYGGDVTWSRRRTLLREELGASGSSDRAARFVCAMVLLLPPGEPIVVSGSVEGEVADAERGTGGFGYDPLFIYPPLARTFAQLSADEKNAVSHRRQAAEELLAALRQRV